MTTKTTQDFFKPATDMFASMPKTHADVKAAFDKIQQVFTTELTNSQTMWKTYQRAATGDATQNEITAANKAAAELIKTSTFASVLAIPGAVFVLPAIIEKAKEYKIDLVPASVAEHFNI